MDIKNLETIHKKIEGYNCKLLAVVKNQKIEDIKKVIDFGINELAENRLEELNMHVEEFPKQSVHFIAPIQSRKLPQILKNCNGIHSIYRKKELDIISDKYQGEDLFIQINIDNDKNKSGLIEEDLEEFMNYSKKINLIPSGIMCIPNVESDRKKIFSKMQNININLKNNFKGYGGQLSMGMSDDYEIALDYGATIVRIGSKIFK